MGGCGKVNVRTKTTTILRSSPLLVMHLLRFQWSPELQRVVKLRSQVDYCPVLPPLAGAQVSDLRAVVVHQGDKPASDDANAGHYTAYVRAQDNYWYHCDDAKRPRQCFGAEALDAEAYMLFFEQR